MGEVLRPLKDDGVLILGSGSATHNLKKMIRDGKTAVEKWAGDFDECMKEALVEGRYDNVNRYEELAPSDKDAHPRPDHLYPLHVAIGAAGENTRGNLIHHSLSFSLCPPILPNPSLSKGLGFLFRLVRGDDRNPLLRMLRLPLLLQYRICVRIAVTVFHALGVLVFCPRLLGNCLFDS